MKSINIDITVYIFVYIFFVYQSDNILLNFRVNTRRIMILEENSYQDFLDLMVLQHSL